MDTSKTIMSGIPKRPFGRNGPPVAIVGQGTWNVPERGDARAEAIRSLRRGVELGLTHVDTAELYGDAETVVGEALREIARDDVFLVSKVLPSNASRKKTIEACERSLRRLGVETLDVYLLHWRGATPLAETFAAFDDLERAGKIAAFGVSNFDVDDLREAIALVGAERIACNQILYNLDERTIEPHEIGFAREHGIATVGYTPFGQRAFDANRRDRELVAIARTHDVTPHAVALAFLTRRDDVFVIPKASTVAHVETNAALPRLSDDEIARIDAAYPVGIRRGGLPML
jgi:diketogulonate reductase-like aldo/keto reductase